MKKTTNMKNSDDTNNCELKDECSTLGVGFINRRLQQFERKSMTIKPPIKPKPNIDSMNRPNFTRVDSLNKIRLELEKKIKTDKLEKPLHPKEPPKSVEKKNSLKKSFTLPQKCSSEKCINFVKNDSFLAEITAKMGMRSDCSTSHSEESIENFQNVLASDRNNVHHIKSQMKTNSVEELSFLHKKNREWSHENQTKTTQNFVHEHGAEEKAEYELVPENTRNSIHNLHGRINVSQKEIGSFLYKNSASCNKKYPMNNFKKLDQQEPEEEAEYEMMPENNRNSIPHFQGRINEPQEDNRSFLHRNSASCDKKYPMNNFKKLDRPEPEEETEYEMMPENNRNSIHYLQGRINEPQEDNGSFLHRNSASCDKKYPMNHLKNLDQQEPEEEAEYELMPENNRNSIHYLHGKINVSHKETGSFLYKNSASCNKKYPMNNFKKLDQQEPEEEAEYEMMPENNRNSIPHFQGRINEPQEDNRSFLHRNSASCDKKYPMNHFKNLDQQEPEEEAEYEMMSENNRSSIHHLQGRINEPQEDNGSFLHRNSASCDKKHLINHNKNIHQEEPVEEAEYDIICENNKKPPHLISTTDNYLYKKGELFNKKHDESSKNPTHLDEPFEEAEYALIVENDNYVIGAQRSNDNYSRPFDMNNNNGSRSYERLVDNSSPIYNEIESDEENIYQVIGFHKPSEHDTNQDDFGFTNLRDPNKSINVSAVNEYCKQTDTNSARNIQGSPVSTEKYQRKLRDLAKELIETEEKYVNCLSHVVGDYIPELHRKDVPESLVAGKDSIFSNIEMLHTFHISELLPSFREAQNDFASLGKAFTDNEENFKLYIQYYINKSKSSDMNLEHKEFFLRRQIEVGEKNSLSTFLLEPIQRMPRYEMLLGQLVNTYIKYYDEAPQVETLTRESPDSWDGSIGSEPELVLGCLKDAYYMIKKILKTVNDRIALDNIEDCQIPLHSQEQGELILQNEFTVLDSLKRRLQLRCFLFENVLLFSTISRLQPKKEVYTYFDAIFMTDLGLTPPEGDKSDRFTVWLQKRTQNPYIIEARGELLSCWVREISEVLWKQAEKDKERLMSMRRPQPVKVIESTTAPCNMPVFLNPEPEKLLESNAPKDKYTSLRRVAGEVEERKKKSRRTTWYTEN